MRTQTAEDMIRVVKPLKIQVPYRDKYYLARLYLVWEHEEAALRRHFHTCTEATVYAERVKARYIRLTRAAITTPVEESNQ